ncbi:hypothetical protein FOZ60_007825 [Perkinsus olseni]|uniref:Uncharacterized protein n=1 Tax=Perkinsus olseni TaxID=32597 RepID=A0A7J6NKR5_PEROL|nr:hypothetical protein FOZ60_007825 [Perkinsus olseni]
MASASSSESDTSSSDPSGSSSAPTGQATAHGPRVKPLSPSSARLSSSPAFNHVGIFCGQCVLSFMSVASSENQDHDEVTAILTSVCEDETTVGVLHKFLCDSHITKARSLATLSPALIAAASTQLRAPDEGDQKMDGTLWKGVVASLLAAARDEALAQIEHQVLLAKARVDFSRGTVGW